MVITSNELILLQKELNYSDFEMSKSLNIDIEEYLELKKHQAINNPRIVSAIYLLESNLELMQINKYAQKILDQNNGPFTSGKILSHLNEIMVLKDDPIQANPITMEWHLSNICNHKCPYCAHRNRTKDLLFPKELIDPVVEDLVKMNVKAVVFSGGGEPLMNNDICYAMYAIKNCNDKIDIGLITNGSRLNKKEIRETITDYCTWVRISVDAGSKETYEKIHGVNTFDEVIQNIQDLVKTKKQYNSKVKIGVSFLLNTMNYNELIKAVKIFENTGIDYFQVKPLIMNVDEKLFSGNIFWRSDIYKHLLALKSYERKDFKIYALGFKFVDMIKYSDKKEFSKCHGHPFYPVITPSGDICVCCLMIDKENNKFSYGKITKDNSLMDIWGNENRLKVADKINVIDCPINCKLSETNKTLEHIFNNTFEDENFLN